MAVPSHPLRVIPPCKAPDRPRRNHHLASHPTHGKPLSRDEVVDRADAEAQSFGGVLLGVQKFFDFMIHESVHRLNVRDRARPIY